MAFTGLASGYAGTVSGSRTTALRAARQERREAALARRATMSPTGPAPGRFRVATWNLNSLRARSGAVDRFLGRAAPDVLFLQETKAAQLSDETADMFERRGYAVAHVGGRAYNGVAVAARHPILDVQASGELGDVHLDREPRLISCSVDGPVPIRAVSVYVPHGRAVGHWHYDFKLGFLEALAERVGRWLLDGGHVVVAGDVNVAPTDSDVFHPDAFTDAVYVTPQVRAALVRLLDVGLVDVDVARWGNDARRFTWWDLGRGYARDLGMRLDIVAVDRALAERLDTTWIDHVERSASRPSDHAALVADFRLTHDTSP